MPPVGQWISETLDIAARLIPVEAGVLLLDDPTSKRKSAPPLTFIAGFGSRLEDLVGNEIQGGRGIVGHVHRTGDLYWTSTPASDARFQADVDGVSVARTRSVAAAPIRLEHNICGVFELVNRKGRAGFSDRDIDLLALLGQHISRSILNAVDVLKQNYLALHDALTGMQNLRGMDAFLREQIRKHRRSEADVSILFVDLDKLKAINDQHGHRGGSEAIRRVSRVLTRESNARGRTFRFGGDEFVLVCPRTPAGEAVAFAEHLLDAIGKRTSGPMRGGGHLSAVTVSIGVASLKTSLRDLDHPHRGGAAIRDRLLTAADRALYRAKRGGRNRVVRATKRDDVLS